MLPTKFEELLSFVAPLVTKSSIRREVISPEERLCITLRYLVTGDAKITIASSYSVSPTTVGLTLYYFRNLCKYLDSADGERRFKCPYNPTRIKGGSIAF